MRVPFAFVETVVLHQDDARCMIMQGRVAVAGSTSHIMWLAVVDRHQVEQLSAIPPLLKPYLFCHGANLNVKIAQLQLTDLNSRGPNDLQMAGSHGNHSCVHVLKHTDHAA